MPLGRLDGPFTGSLLSLRDPTGVVPVRMKRGKGNRAGKCQEKGEAAAFRDSVPARLTRDAQPHR